jgi:hypothetical protein
VNISKIFYFPPKKTIQLRFIIDEKDGDVLLNKNYLFHVIFTIERKNANENFYHLEIPIHEFFMVKYFLFFNCKSVETSIETLWNPIEPIFVLLYDYNNKKWNEEFFDFENNNIIFENIKRNVIESKNDIIIFHQQLEPLIFNQSNFDSDKKRGLLFMEFKKLFHSKLSLSKEIIEILFSNVDFEIFEKKYLNVLNDKKKGKIYENKLKNGLFSLFKNNDMQLFRNISCPLPIISNNRRIFIIFYEQSFYTNPYYLFHSKTFSGLFIFGLRNIYYWGSTLDSMCILEYYLPDEVLGDPTSQFNENISKIRNDYGLTINIYELTSEEENINLNAFFTEDFIKPNIMAHEFKEDLFFTKKVDFEKDFIPKGTKITLSDLKTGYKKKREGRNEKNQKSTLQITEMLENNNLLYNPEKINTELLNALGLSAGVVIILNLTDCAENVLKTLENKIFPVIRKAPFSKFFNLRCNKSKLKVVFFNLLFEPYHLIEFLIRNLQDLGIYYYFSNYFDCQNLYHENFPMNEFLSFGRNCNLLQKSNQEYYFPPISYLSENDKIQYYDVKERLEIFKTISNLWPRLQYFVKTERDENHLNELVRDYYQNDENSGNLDTFLQSRLNIKE